MELKQRRGAHVVGLEVGGDQVREFSFDGPRLALKTDPIDLGKTRVTGTIYWERV